MRGLAPLATATATAPPPPSSRRCCCAHQMLVSMAGASGEDAELVSPLLPVEIVGSDLHLPPDVVGEEAEPSAAAAGPARAAVPLPPTADDAFHMGSNLAAAARGRAGRSRGDGEAGGGASLVVAAAPGDLAAPPGGGIATPDAARPDDASALRAEARGWTCDGHGPDAAGEGFGGGAGGLSAWQRGAEATSPPSPPARSPLPCSDAVGDGDSGEDRIALVGGSPASSLTLGDWPALPVGSGAGRGGGRGGGGGGARASRHGRGGGSDDYSATLVKGQAAAVLHHLHASAPSSPSTTAAKTAAAAGSGTPSPQRQQQQQQPGSPRQGSRLRPPDARHSGTPPRTDARASAPAAAAAASSSPQQQQVGTSPPGWQDAGAAAAGVAGGGNLSGVPSAASARGTQSPSPRTSIDVACGPPPSATGGPTAAAPCALQLVVVGGPAAGRSFSFGPGEQEVRVDGWGVCVCGCSADVGCERATASAGRRGRAGGRGGS